MAKLPGKDAVLAELKRQDIELQGLVEHDAVITAEEMVDRAKSLPGGKAKNLFLKDKKGRMLLVSALHDTPTSTKLLESLKGLKNPRLASDDLLMEKLGVVRGAVSPLAAANDTGDADRRVTVILDKHFQEFDVLCFHPLDNKATIAIKTSDLIKYLEACGHPPEFVDFGEPMGAASQAALADFASSPAEAAHEPMVESTSEAQLTIDLATLQAVPAYEGFYLRPGAEVWVIDDVAGIAWAGKVLSLPRDELGCWSVERKDDHSKHSVLFSNMLARSVFGPPLDTADSSSGAQTATSVGEDASASDGGPLSVKLIPPPNGKGADEGGLWSLKIVDGGSAAPGSAGLRLIQPAAGGKWSVKLFSETVEARTGDVGTLLPAPQPIQVPDEADAKVAAPVSSTGNEDAVSRAARCDAVLTELGLQPAEKHKHEACVASDGPPKKTSNEHHHEVLSVDGHIVVSLFVKGKKKKEQVLVIKKPATKIEGGFKGLAELAGVVGGEVRFADEKTMQATLGMKQDFVSPLALVNALDNPAGPIKLFKVIFDAALQDGKKIYCLPPMSNTESWGLDLMDAIKFAQGCGQTVEVVELEPGSEAAALANRVPSTAGVVAQADTGAASETLAADTPLVRQPWWTGDEALPESKVVTTLKALGEPHDVNQAQTIEAEQESWCTTFYAKCSKTKKSFIITSRPGIKPDLKKLQGPLSAKSLRFASDKSPLCLPEGCENGCITAMSAVADTEGKIISVLDDQIPNMVAPLRMCSGCRDFKDHTQHHIASVRPQVLIKMLVDSGHEPMLVSMS